MMVQMTQTNISIERRQFIKSVVVSAYEHFNKPKLPLEIKSFTRSFSNIRLISYSKHMKRMSLPYSYLINIAKDSYTDYYADINMYYIYYNDIDCNIVSSNRYRWNIAHELGHVLLGHLSDNERTRLTRPTLPYDEYLYLEDEADYFAQLVLVPHSPLFGFNIQNSNHIKLLCKISGPASRKRMYEYNAWKHNGQSLDDYDNRILKYYYSYVYKKKCKTCCASLIQQHGKYCPICGSKNTLQWGEGDKMKYPLLETHRNGKLKECPNCKNEETDFDGDFCQICGKNLINRCGNPDCDNNNALPSNARFCPICGSNSTYYLNNFLKSWNYNSHDGFMNIPDEIEDFSIHTTNEYMTIPDVMDEEFPFN